MSFFITPNETLNNKNLKVDKTYIDSQLYGLKSNSLKELDTL